MSFQSFHLFASVDSATHVKKLSVNYSGNESLSNPSMASIFVDISPSDQVLLRALGPNQILLEFLNPYRPDGMPVSINIRNDPNMPYTPIHYFHTVPEMLPHHPIGLDQAVAASLLNETGPFAFIPYLIPCENVELPQDCNYESPLVMKDNIDAIAGPNKQTELNNETKESIESPNEKKKMRKRCKRRKKKAGKAETPEYSSTEGDKVNIESRTAEATPEQSHEVTNAVADESEKSDASNTIRENTAKTSNSIENGCEEETEGTSQTDYYPLIIRNVKLDDPNEYPPNDLNLRCSQRLKSEIPTLMSVSTRCIVMECSHNGHGFYGTVKLDVSRVDVRDELASYGSLIIEGRNCALEKSGSRINAFRCFRCQMYCDHDAKTCKESREYCLKCSESHRFKDCPVRDHRQFRCINCVRGGRSNVQHMAGTFYCPIEIEQRNLMKRERCKKQARQSLETAPEKSTDRSHSTETVTQNSDIKPLTTHRNSKHYWMFV